MKTRAMSCVIGLLAVTMVQARNKQYTRLATSGDPTFDLVISYWEDPDGDNDGDTQDPVNPSAQDKIENIIGYMADAVYETAEGTY